MMVSNGLSEVFTWNMTLCKHHKSLQKRHSSTMSTGEIEIHVLQVSSVSQQYMYYQWHQSHRVYDCWLSDGHLLIKHCGE